MAYQCSTCNKSYTTASHLARHAVAHQPDRQFKCSFCSKSYLRQDIARRHSERCPRRQGRPVTKQQSRGQPRKACNRCASAKISCTKADPCGTCVKAGVQCSYSRLELGPATPTEDTANSWNTIRKIQTNGHTIASAITASRVPFLLSYTAAEAGNPRDFAQALETLRGHSDRVLLQDEVNTWDDSLHPFSMFTPFFAADMLLLDVPQGSSSLLDLLPQSALTSDAHDDALRRRTSDLIAFLEENGRASSSHDMIATLLTPTNLGLCMENFFQYAYRHVPIVHKPSFDMASAELPLLLSIFVVGAVWSYPRDTYFMVLDIVELTERCIFESDLFKTLQGQDSKYVTASSLGGLPLLQAATMLISISFAFPNADHRRRFRSQRFSDLISITRLLKYNNKGSSYSQIADAAAHFEWTNYITRESCNRVIYYTYLLDCHISTLYATIPRMPILEMQACLPSDESAFGAENAETCRDRLSSVHSAPRLSLVDVIQGLIADDPMRQEFSRLTAFPLFLTIGALQAMIFTAKTQLLEISQSVRFERALARWKEIWDHSQTNRPLSKEVGFMVHAEEVWLLAQKVLKSDASKLISRFGVNDMTQVRRWLTELD